jgi:hypothetical protein
MKLSDCKSISDLKTFSKNGLVYAVCNDGYIAILNMKSADNTYRMDLDKTCFYIESSTHVAHFYNVFPTEKEAKKFSDQVVKKNLENRKSSLLEEKNRIELEICNINKKLKEMP